MHRSANPRHTIPLATEGLFGKKDSMIRQAIMARRSIVGTKSRTLVVASALTGCRSRRNRNSITGTVASAPSSTPKKMPGRPFIQKKSRKSIPA